MCVKKKVGRWLEMSLWQKGWNLVSNSGHSNSTCKNNVNIVIIAVTKYTSITYVVSPFLVKKTCCIKPPYQTIFTMNVICSCVLSI